MNSIPDFEDMLALLNKYNVHYLIIGGLAFIFHAKPRYTKDMDIWVENTDNNIEHANLALAEFGSPALLDFNNPTQVLQLGVAPNRIDFLVTMECLTFTEAWALHVQAPYGETTAHWIDIKSLLKIKDAINHPRHQEDARVLRQILQKKTGMDS